jgi:hypothetical protein
MKTSDLLIVICAVILLSNMQTLENTLNVFMKIWNSINAAFVRRVLAKKKVLKASTICAW